jgi:hypothetical protein
MKKMILAVCLLAIAPIAIADVPPAIPQTPAAVDELVSIRPFTLENGFEFRWSAEKPLVESGYILVIKVNPDLVYPRQIEEPVLYVGNQTAQRINFGHESGYVVALVPGEVDFTTAPIWFGTPALPERVDSNRAQTERRLADRAGIKPFTAEQVQAAMANGGTRLSTADMDAMLEPLANLVQEYSPAENELVESFRMAAANSK